MFLPSSKKYCEPVNNAIESELATIYIFAPTAVVRREPITQKEGQQG
jgi:hypothetical protein